MSQIRRGDIWLVSLNPTKGHEMQKCRPCVVISQDTLHHLPLKIICPITEWQEKYSVSHWHITLESNSSTGLNKRSLVDSFQIRCIDEKRFIKRIGVVNEEELLDIVSAVALIIDVP